MHGHSHGGSDIPKLRLALAVTLGILVLEAGGGFAARSLALLADAAHMLTDAGAAALGLWAASVATRRHDAQHTFGYGRATVLAALANATALFAIVVFLIYEAIVRVSNPQPVEPRLMTGVALVALIANLLLTWVLSRGEKESLNVRAVIAHVMGDAFVSAAVILAAIGILLTHLSVIDPAVSIVASLAVAFSAWTLVRDSLNILMERTPQGLDVTSVQTFLLANAPVDGVHDVHVWCVSDRRIAASLHVRVPATRLAEGPATVSAVKKLLHDKFAIEHCTVEIECDDCDDAC